MKKLLKKPKKSDQESIIVPIEWLNGLVKRAEIAEKNKDYVIPLIGFASSAKTLLKYGIRR